MPSIVEQLPYPQLMHNDVLNQLGSVNLSLRNSQPVEELLYSQFAPQAWVPPGPQ